MTTNALKPTVKIECKGKSFEIGIPTIGEYIQIESLKQAVTNGRYAIMAYGGLETSEKALDLVDAVVYFSILGGDDFLTTYNAKDHEQLLKMSIVDSVELTHQYKEVYAPFYNSIVERKDRPVEKLKYKEKTTEKVVKDSATKDTTTKTEEKTTPVEQEQ